MGDSKYLDTADVAKIIRKELKATWPETKFSVRISRYAGGSSVRVGWTDGPKQREVETLVGRWQGKDFDGMTDSTTYRGAFEHEGELVHTTCWVSCSRDHSPLANAQAVNAICKYYGADPGLVRLDPERGHVVSDGFGFLQKHGEYLSTLMWQWFEQTGRFRPDEEATTLSTESGGALSTQDVLDTIAENDADRLADGDPPRPVLFLHRSVHA